MDEAEAARFWCHSCSQIVNPIEVELIECPLCQSGFVEEMETAAADAADAAASTRDRNFGASDSDQVLTLLAPILLGMMSNNRRGRRFRRFDFEDSDDNNDNNNDHHYDEETELDREHESTFRRRRRAATILQRLRDIRAGMASEMENSERSNRDGERVVLINPFSQTIIIQGSHDSNDNSQSQPISSLGDYFVGPSLDMLLQHLAENDPNRYGTPPAQKEAVEAMPTVKIESSLQCSVCLEDFDLGNEAKEMPCNHKFHSGCILPWLELHSSCPVCRYQLPSDESKPSSDASGNINNSSTEGTHNGNSSNHIGGEVGDASTDNRRRFSVHLPWPLNLFSSSSSQSGNGNSTSTSSFSLSGSSTNPWSSTSDIDEH